MLLNSSDFVKSISPEKRDIFIERARQSNTSAITFQDFVNIVSFSIILYTHYLKNTNINKKKNYTAIS